MSRHLDSIAALATPAGTAAIAVVRASGPDTEALAAGLAGVVPPPRVARHINYRARDGELIDDVIVTFFKGPHSYSGEDSLEISCHGNPFIAQKILEDLLSRGCRIAEPGEFTQRAFLNGKMDLSQAEAVMDLIHARSERALAAANQQLRGGLARRMDVLVESLLAVLARVEAYIDFPDEDLPVEDRESSLRECQRITFYTNKLLATSRYGELLRDGLKTVIIGAPNAGKSSLLNRLVGKERALVSPEPGTTRDYIEERILVGPHLVRLIDTAGLNVSPAPLERLGIEKTMERVDEADLFLLVVDSSRATGGEPLPSELRTKLRPERTLVVYNKVDLLTMNPSSRGITDTVEIPVSALTGTGIEQLREAIIAKADGLGAGSDDLVTINARHANALNQARKLLGDAEAKLAEGGPAELLASDLRGVLSAFGEITGRIDNEKMLDRLFAEFCIGK